MQSDASRWDKKYSDSQVSELKPEPLLVKFVSGINTRSGAHTALDIAAGRCHAGVYLAKLGFRVTALDCSAVGLALGSKLAEREQVRLRTQVTDLDSDPLPKGPWSVICCFRYLSRDLFPQMAELLEPQGLLIFATFNIHHLIAAPQFSPQYVLQPGELQRSFEGLDVIALSDGDDPNKPTSWIVARRP